ncbi:MAG: hypothetical protein J6L73_09260 [Muribaculaceae bacterium]|nr:hypothetical protein [Muribaculaceae bacterium]
MKRFLFLITVAILSVTVVFAAKPDFGSDGTTYEKDGQTLDFYNNGMVVYKAQGAPESRRGEWHVKDNGRVGGNYVTDVPITVEIYVGNRTVTMTGTLTYAVNKGTNVGQLRLNGERWRKW